MDPQKNISQNCSVAFLTLTAIGLACTAGILNGQRSAITPSPAGATSRAGFYVVTTTPPAIAGSDLLWIANVYTEQLVVYDTDNNGNIRPLARADLTRIFQGKPLTTEPGPEEPVAPTTDEPTGSPALPPAR
jgi:hypothetical protein